MYIFNITFVVNQPMVERWMQWMKHQHLPWMLHSGLLHKPRIAKIVSQDLTSGVSFAVQYEVNTLNEWELWQQKNAFQMQTDCRLQFGEDVLFFTTLLETIPLTYVR